MEFDATFLISVISFVVFVFIMNKIFYAPILKIMQERQHFVDENFNSARATKEETLTQIKLHDNELEKTREEARNTIASESKRIKQENAKLIAEFRRELTNDISKEKESLRNSAYEAKETLKEDAVNIAKSISGLILGDDITSETINKEQIKEE